MRVRFYNEGTQMVEQSAIIESTIYGNQIAGYNPVYPGTNTKHPTYSPDNFYISVDEYGNLNVVNVDDRGVTAEASIRLIEGKYSINDFLSDFNWRLDYYMNSYISPY